MIAFDEHKLRDHSYRERFRQKLAEIRAVKQQHTFIAYATHRQLVSELRALYENNLKDYEICYLDNVRAFEALQSRMAPAKPHIHKARQRALQQQLALIKQKLDAEDYNLNAEAKKLIEEAEEKREAYLREYATWEQELTAYRMQLKTLMNQVWSEQFEVFKNAYQQHKADVMGEHLPTESIRLAPDTVQAAIEARTVEVNRLVEKAARVPRFMAAAAAFQDSYASYEAFTQLEGDIDRALRNRSRLRWVAIALLLALLGTGAYWGPGLYRAYNEDNAWEKSQAENSFVAYRHYLQTYPEGRYIHEARDAQLRLDYSVIPDFTDINGQLFAYEGELKMALPEGKGLAIYPNGDRYEGEWQGGIRSGQGALIEAGGDRYEGMWKFGKPDGKGTKKFANGDDYAGEWKNGLFQGRGSLTFADGSFYDGQWVAGKREGRGTFQSAERLKYTGEWKAGKREGNGTQDYADGSTYIGAWQADQRSGQGALYFPDRSQFTGQWSADQIRGEGVYTSKLRESFTGSWEGIPEQITLKDPGGNILRQGKWEDGLFMSQ